MSELRDRLANYFFSNNTRGKTTSAHRPSDFNGLADAVLTIVLEECAKVCDEHTKTWRLKRETITSEDYRLIASAKVSSGEEIATAIRALK